MDIDEILAERGARYGEFRDHAFIAQLLKSVMMGDIRNIHHETRSSDTFEDVRTSAMSNCDNSWNNKLAPDQREALDMIAHKVARILNGDPNYSDSWRDIAGYATLVADRLDGKVK